MAQQAINYKLKNSKDILCTSRQGKFMNTKFNKSDKYPDPASTFSFRLDPIDDMRQTCLFVLDTNILLLPYGTDNESLNTIEAVYETLSAQKRIFIPAQVAREFFDNRPNKLSAIHDDLKKKQSSELQLFKKHPFLNEVNEFKKVLEKEVQLQSSFKAWKDEINKTIAVVQGWGWDDPVSKMYHKVLKSSVLPDIDFNNKEFEADLARRNTLKIPPGYKDSGKTENQAGDLLIWHEILKLGSQHKQHIIFVSSDDKADWWHRSSGKPLYPRFELVDEFRAKSDGKSFHIVKLSQLLKWFDADKAVVASIENTEREATIPSPTPDIDNDLFIRGAHNFIDTLRNHINIYELEIRSIAQERNGSPETAENNRPSFISRELSATQKLMQEYNQRHHEAIIFRDGLINILPQSASANRSTSWKEKYANPDDPVAVREITDDLAQLTWAVETY